MENLIKSSAHKTSPSTSVPRSTASSVQAPVSPKTAPTDLKTVKQPAGNGPVLRPLTQDKQVMLRNQKGTSMNKSVVGVLVVLALLLGSATGYMLASRQAGNTQGGLKNEPGLQREVTGGDIKVGTKVGLADNDTFKDSGEGVLEKGGIDGEGSHHIVRPGGDSQTLYVTSSVIDLDQFTGRKVKVWGETFAGQKAGWLMDVGKLEVLE